MRTITKKELTQAISRKRGLDHKSVHLVVQELFDYITESLNEGNRLEFRDFGVFEVVRRERKIGRNPRAPEISIVIPARNAVKFTPRRKLKLAFSK